MKIRVAGVSRETSTHNSVIGSQTFRILGTRVHLANGDAHVIQSVTGFVVGTVVVIHAANSDARGVRISLSSERTETSGLVQHSSTLGSETAGEITVRAWVDAFFFSAGFVRWTIGVHYTLNCERCFIRKVRFLPFPSQLKVRLGSE